MVLEWLDSHMQKQNKQPSTLTLHHTQILSWNYHRTKEAKIKRFLEVNTGDNLYKLKVRKDFLERV